MSHSTLVVAATLIAALLYATTCLCIGRQMAGAPLLRPLHYRLLWLLALVGHGVALQDQILMEGGAQLTLFNAGSFIFLIINSLLLAVSLRHPVDIMALATLPCSLLVIAASHWIPIDTDTTPLAYGIAVHILLSVASYSLLTLAVLQAAGIAYQNRSLRQRQSVPALVRHLPPLQSMENLLFQYLSWGFVALSVAIASGFLFIDNFFAQHLIHKTAFSLLSWLLFAILLAGRHFLGWRGYTAIRWTLGGFSCLLLAYFGTKLVLEVLLDRV